MSDRDFPAIPYQNNMDAVTFHQTSAENYVLSVQTYRFARLVLEAKLGSRLYANPCVVMDLDETVLDNSDYQAWLIATGRNYHEPTTWKAWCRLKRARAVPGAVGFIRFATDVLKLNVFFVTSRVDADCRQETFENLQAIGVPISASEANAGDLTRNRLFMKGMSKLHYPGVVQDEFELKDKFAQRVFIENVRGFEIILSVGDNLSDYADYYGSRLQADGKKRHDPPQARKASAEQDRSLWGTDFILIPNAVYGGWQRAIYENGAGDESERAYESAPVRGVPAETQRTRMDLLSHDLPIEDMKKLAPEMDNPAPTGKLSHENSLVSAELQLWLPDFWSPKPDGDSDHGPRVFRVSDGVEAAPRRAALRLHRHW